ncbi:hypothetical protein KKC13_08145 [bacterium]|nr:hypothetical protein [bacterium]MBU1958564.1 hypothetical protein [bacterium]
MTISLLTATTLATASPNEQMGFATLNKSDSHMLFGHNNNNVIALGQDEMKNTEGEWGIWGAIAGAISGAYGYLGYSAGSGSWSWSRLGMATTQGAIAGAILPTPTAIRWTATRYTAMSAGVSTGWLWR